MERIMRIVNKYDEIIKIEEQGAIANGEQFELHSHIDPKITPFITPGLISRRIDFLAREISSSYIADTEIYAVIVLNGSIIFFADLIRAMKKYQRKHVYFQPIKIASYEGKESTGNVKMILDLYDDVTGKDVIVIEDIVDTGKTVEYLKNYLLEKKKARSVKICTLLDKPARRKVKVKLDFTGFVIPDRFVVGYGMDFEQKYRDLSFIGYLRN